ncbi:hypothetical protein ALNOE001_15600 [Candidatus Methanobinarius endosymbioticus]|uniref:Big-1 domain-containing protein n=1 Tax=Candidatus Methanobinarius endosymbioticus TaxID=2006182 RepID=A0A366MB31_9EURY|nr:hypothetical protein ALNOE001_15600 [Candidatus Methanobinarius endosymbioticus]
MVDLGLPYILNTTGNIGIIIDYNGNEIYSPSKNFTSFEGLKLVSYIQLNSLNNTKINETVVISGILYDENGNPIVNGNIEVIINGNLINLTTNSLGQFITSHITNIMGSFDVFISYLGNNIFEQSVNSTYFEVSRFNSTIVLDSINDTKINNSVIASGILLDENGNPIVNSRINIFVNGDCICFIK